MTPSRIQNAFFATYFWYYWFTRSAATGGVHAE